MESYEDLRLEQKDKIPKLSFFERLFKKSEPILEQNLDFLEERYQNNPILDSNSLTSKEDLQTDVLLLDDLFLKNKNLPVLEDENTESHLETQEREAVLDAVDLNTKEIPFKMVLITLCAMAFVLALFIPKIYARNNIYYASRNIIQLQAQIDSLREENKHIKKQLEDIKFKNLTQELDF